MRKIKSLKKMSFRKYGEVEIGGYIVPIKTLSLAEEASALINFPNDIPRKLERPTEQMKEYLTKNDPKYTPQMYPMLRIYDATDPVYIETADKIQRYNKTLEAIKYIDFDAVVDDAGTTLYNDLGVNKGDWFAICAKFEEMGFGSVEFEKIVNKAKALSGSTTFEMLDQIQQITNMDMFSLLTKLEILSKEDSKKNKITPSQKTLEEIEQEELSIKED